MRLATTLGWRVERLRAAQNRQNTRADHAAERRVDRQTPCSWFSRSERQEKKYPITPHLQDEVAAPFAWKELRDCRQENDEELLEPERDPSWKKLESRKRPSSRGTPSAFVRNDACRDVGKVLLVEGPLDPSQYLYRSMSESMVQGRFKPSQSILEGCWHLRGEGGGP